MSEDNRNNENNKDERSEEEIRAENEYLKLKLLAETGSQFDMDDETLDPSLENDFLKYIHAFEKAYNEDEERQIYEILGEPDLKPSSEISDEEIEEAYYDLVELLEKHQIQVDVLAQYDDEARRLYRFITEELIHEKIFMMPMGQGICHFIYEEFHPNHPYEIEKNALEFAEKILGSPWDEYSDHLLVSEHEQTYNQYQYVKEKIQKFQSIVKEVDVQLLDVETVTHDLDIHEGKVEIECAFEYFSVIQGNGHVEGTLSVYFTYFDGFWFVTDFEFPGLNW
ncbi:MAG: hypothetical protein LAT68_01725 [Cyclobacteriaceae bacterium]|nr:hypothetical protein [Cyclobacteriaceae bacterium]MCH8515022.1 hypothetical protein [Cyclobacteriaceae bacterium]